jgi:pSer/pThr/pTyr-binding forkhead associated (FHA) protein
MPRLVIREGPGVGRDHALGAGACIVGRDAKAATFVLEDSLASRRHVQIVAEAGAWYAEDMGSTNGTIVNGQRIQRVQLRDGDTIQVGGTVLAFVQKDILAGRPARARQAQAPSEARPAQTQGPAPVRRRRHIRRGG